MNKLRTTAALALARAAGTLSRRLHLGGGTSLPGQLARALDPTILTAICTSLSDGVILVAGTNGKTTTSRMLAAILEQAGESLLHNRAGANLLPGLTTVAIGHADWHGRPRVRRALFETDEAALPQAISETHPRLVVLLNLFRDQLDRYGEIDTIAGHWRKSLQTLPPASTVVFNADDPALADITRNLAARALAFGLEDERHAVAAATHIADSQFCHHCGHRYEYRRIFYAHIGHYACPQCGRRRPEPAVALTMLEPGGLNGSELQIDHPAGVLRLRLPIPGLYNAQNALAAAAAALALGIAPATISAALTNFQAAFGRIERITAGPDGPPLLIALIKNPVGASETVRMLTSTTTTPLHLLIAINDRFADGTDVSWLWDADFEPLAGRVAHVIVSGTRAADMALRLDYAGVDGRTITVIDDLPAALDAALAALPPGETLAVLPTYTAMLDLRAEIARRGWARPFWEA
ncbi:MurT ligase domain-containing protein [Chloroflexus sp.]|uniref:MurT ligase domain-containing protein n=1 Tax=Chloroflexus sp. TaxID=1904827 RepID=UPI0026198676|nr:MurT ligase domain-containing protein [uncultured Chloroflexus sp.]